MRTNIVCALADVVATKLGIVLLIFYSFFLSFQKGFAYDFEFLHAFLSNKKIRFSPKKQEWDPSFTPQIFISGWTAGMGACKATATLRVLKWNGVRALWESENPLWQTYYLKKTPYQSFKETETFNFSKRKLKINICYHTIFIASRCLYKKNFISFSKKFMSPRHQVDYF